MDGDLRNSAFHGVDWDAIYETDLVYEANCWTKCGDAHCCSFSRHKSRFMFMGRKHFQELPLLPGEYDYLRQTGRLEQFGDHKHKRTEFTLRGGGVMILDSIVSYRPGCACEHAHRPTVCRLYPLFPVLDIEGRLVEVDERFGVYEELEMMEGLGRTCEVRAMPFDQLNLLLRLVHTIARSPLHIFYLQAYRLTKSHAFANLSATRASSSQSAFSLFEGQYLTGALLNQPELQEELGMLADQFEARYGSGFGLRTGLAA
jgi:hypothetical protein